MSHWRGLRFAGRILSQTVNDRNGFTAFQRAYQPRSNPRATPSALGEKVLYLDATKKKVQLTDTFSDGIFQCPPCAQRDVVLPCHHRRDERTLGLLSISDDIICMLS